MQRTTEIELAALLAHDSKYAWDVSMMSKTENEEMRSQIRLLHASDRTWKRKYDKLLQKKLQQEQRERQLRLQQLLLQQEKETKQRQLEQQEQKRLEEQRKLQVQAKREHLLHEEHLKQLEFQREFASTVQDYRLLWKLQNVDKQHPPPDRALRFPRPPGPSRPMRSLRPPPATGTMPVL
jgi:hypothetical protein